MWTEIYFSYLRDLSDHATTVNLIQSLGFDVLFINKGKGWISIIVEIDFGYIDGYGETIREALLDGLHRLNENENTVLDSYKAMIS